MAVWTCFSCDVDVEFAEPTKDPQFLSTVLGRTTFLIDGQVVHRCEEGKYHQPNPSLQLLQ